MIWVTKTKGNKGKKVSKHLQVNDNRLWITHRTIPFSTKIVYIIDADF